MCEERKHAGGASDTRNERMERYKRTYQLSVSGLTVGSLFLCFHQVRQLAFSRRMPLAMAFFWRVMERHERQTSSSFQLWER